MAKFIKDTLGLCTMLTPPEEMAARKHGIPTMRGVLYKVNEDANGNPIFDQLTKVNENTVVLGGAVLALEKLFGVTPTYIPSTINSDPDLGINSSLEADISPINTTVKCFGVGTGGSDTHIGSYKDPDFKMKSLPEWIPFRISDTDHLDDSIASKYYYRRQIKDSPDPQWGWYLKEFESTPALESHWRDTPDPNATGSIILEDVSNSKSTNLIETFAECIIKIEADDIRPYFQWAGDLQQARYNSIGLFTGVKRVIDQGAGYTDYAGVRLFSVVNFNNIPLDLPTSATYLYRVYAAV